jgi:pimeloyl-ACP methyl ester carboxylesterase
MRTRLVAFALLALLARPGTGEVPAPAATLTIGALRLASCGESGAYCGTLSRALDPSGRVPGTLAIHFEFYPHTDTGPAAGTIVAIEGGPGYASTGSRDHYLALYAPLRAARDVLLMDARGTGGSGAIDCEPLQSAPRITTADVGACGRALGAAAPLYSAAYAADDLAALLAALGSGPIDLYGDSYGTFAAQVYAWRHPELLRSLTLDSGYALDGPDEAWVPSYAPAMRRKFSLACARSEDCRDRAGPALGPILAALEQLRRHPFAARARDADGRWQRFRADARALALVMYASAPSRTTIRELDAAARAFAADDRAPLLRLMAETQASTDSRDGSHDPREFSVGMSVAVMCQDAPQIFDMRTEPAARLAARDRLIAERERREPRLYAPFTFAEYRSLPLDYTYIEECVEWPAPPPEHPPQQLVPANATAPAAPVLVLIGEFDNLTTPEQGEMAAADYPNARRVLLTNSTHVNAKPGARSSCASEIARRFVATLDPGDTSCAASIPPLALVPQFARRAALLAPVAALPGNQADASARRVASAALATLRDVLDRLESNTTGRGTGLRGGRFVQTRCEHRCLRLEQLRFVDDLAVSGTLSYGGLQGESHASLRLAGPGGVDGRLAIEWRAEGRARLAGRLGAARLRAEAEPP